MIRTRRGIFTVVIALVLGVLGVRPALAAKLDMLTLRNGDKITGEIESLDKGRLQYSTDDIGTLSIEWDKVASVTSPRMFDVELDTGRHLYGALLPPPSVGVLRVGAQGDTAVVGILSVVHIQALEQSFLKQLDGSVDLGLYLASANSLSQLSIDFIIKHRTREHYITLSGSSQSTTQADVEDVDRSDLELNYSRILTDRWFAQGTTGAERNSELGIDLRVSLGALGGRYVVQSNTNLLGLGAGVIGSLENPNRETSRWNTEAAAGFGWSLFKYDFPKTNVDVGSTVYRDLTKERLRVEADLNAKREVIKDFTVGIIASESYDSDPPAGGTHNDWTLKFTVGWTY